jgi:hypothetical protein
MEAEEKQEKFHCSSRTGMLDEKLSAPQPKLAVGGLNRDPSRPGYEHALVPAGSSLNFCGLADD